MLRTQAQPAHEVFLTREAAQVRADLAQDHQRRRFAIASLSADIPALWHAPQTTVADRKAILRHLVDEVVVHVKPGTEYTDVTIRWQGGFTSQHEVRRSVRDYKDMRD